MTSIYAVLATGVTTFVATNIDDLVLLTLFFARRVKPRRVVAGQYLGFSAIILVSLLGAWAAFAIPHRWIRLLGVLPLALGIKELMLGHRDQVLEARVEGHGIASVALITLANGADNVGVYVPLFVVSRADIWLVIVTYMVLIAVWCLAASLLGNHRLILSLVNRWGHRIMPFVFIALGAYVLVFK